MALYTDARQVRELYREAAELGFLIPGLNAENRDTLECVFTAAKRLGSELGVPHLPVCVSVTGRYQGRSQLPNYTSLGCAVEGLLAFEADMKVLLRAGGPFEHLRVHAHLDHGQPDLDQDLFDLGRGLFGSVMFDASARPMAENRDMTRQFVEEWRETYLVEGAVDELPVSGAPTRTDDLTRPEEAKRFLDETGVDLIVVNVGTEHRATAERARYHADRARAIAEVAGGRMVLHGTSSLGKTSLREVAADGFVRFNLWTAVETLGGQAIARDTLRNLRHILPRSELEALRSASILGDAALAQPGAPSLSYLPHQYRRDKVWAPAVTEYYYQVLSGCGYERLAPGSR